MTAGYLRRDRTAQRKPTTITNHHDEYVLDGGNHAVPIQTLTQHGYTHHSEEQPMPAFIWKNFDGRWKLMMYLPVSKAEEIHHLGSKTHVGVDGLVPLSPPFILVQFDQLDQMTNTTHADSSNSFSYSRDKNLRKSQQRNKRSRPFKCSSNDWLHNCFLPNNSIGMACDDSSLNVSEVLDNNARKMDKSPKKNSRKKGKKKGKRFKKSTHRKEPETELHSERTSSQSPSCKTHACFGPSCSGKGATRSYSSKSATSCVSVQSSKDKPDDEECSSGNYLNNLITQDETTFFHEKMNESEPAGSLSGDFSCAVSSCNNASLVEDAHNHSTSSSIEHIDVSSRDMDQENHGLNSSVLSSFDEEIENNRYENNCNNMSEYQAGPDDVAKESCLNQTCCSTLQSSITFKSSRDGRKRPGTSNNVYRYHNISSYGLSGKDSSHSVWQRVQKRDVNKYATLLKDTTACQQSNVGEDHEISMKGSSFSPTRVNRKQKSCKNHFLDETAIQSNATNLHSTTNYPNGLPCKSHGEKTVHNPPAKLKIKTNSASKQDATHFSKKYCHGDKYNDIKHLKTLDRHDEMLGKSSLVGYPEQASFSGGYSNGDLQIENSHSIMVKNNQTEVEEEKEIIVENQFNPSIWSSNTDTINCHEVHSIGIDNSLHNDGHHSEGNLAEYWKQEQHSGLQTKKWIPILKKDLTISSKDHEDDLIPKKETAIDIDGKHCSGIEKLAISTISMVHKSSFVNFCQETHDDYSGLGADLDKIVKAVNDAHRLQTVCEDYHLLTGTPIAEFERVLQSASPVVYQVQNISICQSCTQKQLVGDSTCQCQIPNILLGDLWHWYEKPGSYGLEVRVEDHLMKSLGNARFEFRAYFVPYLSAIQIFKQTQKLRSYERSNSDCIQSINCRTLAVSDKCKHLASGIMEDNGELLFEYFESELPQQRRPLFQKIKEMTRGDVSSNCNIFGNPSILEYMRLCDVHPASWFSVAWYPIYRIPDGNFRAAFLTYHSLGNFVHRNSVWEPDVATHITSPVVGLQSYNSKDECWFRQSGHRCEEAKNETSLPDPTEILKERLRTLEQTASMMARSSVHKGEKITVNRQSDYEFFLSRRW